MIIHQAPWLLCVRMLVTAGTELIEMFGLLRNIDYFVCYRMIYVQPPPDYFIWK